MDPYVVTYVRHDESRPSVMLIVIENVGRGLARDLTFELSRSIPHRAFGMDEASARKHPIQQMDRGPLITGIPALGPGDQRKIIWGQYAGLYFALSDQPVEVTCNYKTQDGQSRKSVCFLDIRSFEVTDATDPDGARQSARQLKRIADDVHNGLKDLKTLTARLRAEEGRPEEEPEADSREGGEDPQE